MQSQDRSKDFVVQTNREVFLLWLVFSAVAACVQVIFLLKGGNADLGTRIILAGVSGIMGSCLAPLLGHQLYRRDTADGNGIAFLPRLAELLVYIAGGFGAAVVAFSVTSALLVTDLPTVALSVSTDKIQANLLGIATFGGIVGFFLGRAILNNRSSMASNAPAVVSALGNLEDQLFGPPVLNYDGFAMAEWQPSSPQSMTIGKVSVRFVAKTKYLKDAMVSNSDPDSTNPSQSIRVLLEGGKNAPQVPFSVSIISTNYSVQPQSLVLAAPAENDSEEFSFTFVKRFSAEQNSVRPSTDEFATTTEQVLIDISQAGRTIQISEMRIPVAGVSPPVVAPDREAGTVRAEIIKASAENAQSEY